MAKKIRKERPVNVSGKPRHSLDVNRPNDKKGAGGGGGRRSAATVRRLRMYPDQPKRDSRGKILKNSYQSSELPDTRIEPNRKWFGERFLLCPHSIFLIARLIDHHHP
jgi:nuclear GTP-binding protein